MFCSIFPIPYIGFPSVQCLSNIMPLQPNLMPNLHPEREIMLLGDCFFSSF